MYYFSFLALIEVSEKPWPGTSPVLPLRRLVILKDDLHNPCIAIAHEVHSDRTGSS